MDELDAVVKRILKLYEHVEVDEEEAGKVWTMSSDGKVSDYVPGSSQASGGNPYDSSHVRPSPQSTPSDSSGETNNDTTDNTSSSKGSNWLDKLKCFSGFSSDKGRLDNSTRKCW